MTFGEDTHRETAPVACILSLLSPHCSWVSALELDLVVSTSQAGKQSFTPVQK
jgi:hypothetical protein